MKRAILHCDLNNFYASVECLYNPDIRNMPVAVCGSPEARHGIVLAKNYIAKKFGIKTGDSIFEAKKKCPNLITVKPNFPQYLRYSSEAKKIYREYTDLVESFGIDECWLDVTQSLQLFGSAEKIANEIRNRIYEELGVTASIGVSFNKIFAKLGSDLKKPNATTIISEENFKSVIWNLPASELIYVGNSTIKKLHKLSIFTIGDLANSSCKLLESNLGKWGQTLWTFANGYDDSPVSASDSPSIIKSIGNSITTPRDLVSNDDVKILLYVLSESVAERLRKCGLVGNTVQIQLKNNLLESISRQGSIGTYTCSSEFISKKAYELFSNNWSWNSTIRSVGVRITNLSSDNGFTQLSFLQEENRKHKLETLERSIDILRERFGHYSIQRAIMLKDPALNTNPVEENVIFPISYFG